MPEKINPRDLMVAPVMGSRVSTPQGPGMVDRFFHEDATIMDEDGQPSGWVMKGAFRVLLDTPVDYYAAMSEDDLEYHAELAEKAEMSGKMDGRYYYGPGGCSVIL